MATNPLSNNPDVEQFPKHDRFGLPMVPKAERGDWLPFRPICEQVGYDLPQSFGEGWVVRVYDWRFERIIRQEGQASPERLMIHRSWYPGFLEAAGVRPDAATVLDIATRFLEALDKANEAFDDVVDEAREARIVAQDQAENEFLNALAAREKSRSG